MEEEGKCELLNKTRLATHSLPIEMTFRKQSNRSQKGSIDAASD